MEKNTAEQRQNLAELLQDRARWALVRAQFSMSNEIDAPTSFFLLVGKMTPGRSIHDNLHLFCDIMDLAKLSNVNLGLLSWIRRRPLTEWTMATCLRLYTLLEWESFLLLG